MTVNRTAKAEKVAGAAPDGKVDWHAINWRKIHRNVKRLQARIVKAMQAGKLQNRVPYRAFERLERCAGKLARTVLRGGGGSNAVSLPDGD